MKAVEMNVYSDKLYSNIKTMRQLFNYLIIGVFFVACSSSETESSSKSKKEQLMSLLPTEPVCPVGSHKDSLIPCLFGMPTEESFVKADSGLLWLGGCELPSDNPPEWHCKIHNIQF